METDIILKVEDLSSGFTVDKKEIAITKGVSFEVHRGKTLAIVGESGCGKSVTVHTVMQLLPKNGKIMGGKATYYKDGKAYELSSMKRYGKELRAIRGAEIGMVFQDPMSSLNPVYTVGAQVSANLIEHFKMSKKETRAKVVDMFAKLGIPDPERRFDQYPHEFSGGMKQRVMIAIAMICNPQLIIADEPTTALDVTIQAQIMDLMKSLQKAYGKSIILITHNMGLVAEMADDVAVMYMFTRELRTVARSESVDFINWTPPVEVFKGVGRDDQIYAMPFFQDEGKFYGLPAIFHQGDESLEHNDCVDIELAFSGDTVQWDRIAPGRPLIPRGKGHYPTGEYDCGCCFPCPPVDDGEQWRYTSY